ncbi:DUF3899 domain-containing protein [Furfurilactobacillus curtus]|uniref:DUF3899 domain-containing protein n=1 Tax=Furfurilactobacillus curtus TaxID=1746200 RepID=A0ABQ5JNM0_9LACO
MKPKNTPIGWSLGGLGLFLVAGVVAWISHVPLIKISDAYFMIGLFLIVIGAVMQLSHAHLFTGFRRRRKTYKEKQDQQADDRVNQKDIALKKNEPLRVSAWNGWLWISGLILIGLAVILTL